MSTPTNLTLKDIREKETRKVKQKFLKKKKHIWQFIMKNQQFNI